MRKTLLSLTPLLLLFFILSCQKERSFELAAPGAGALQDASGECSPKIVGGTYVAGKALTDSNYIDVGVFVVKKGSYNISAPAQNGFSFKGSGTFADTGLVMVRLKGSGIPTTAGNSDFTITYDSLSCAVAITVLPAGSTGGGGASGTCNATINGSYVKAVALSVSNTVALQHTYAAAGTYTVSTDTVNGYSFKKVITAVAGTPTTIALDGVGAPVNSGINRFKLNFGTGNAADTCGFEVTVAASAPPPVTNTSYFPMTANSWWSYDYPVSSGDTIKTYVAGSETLINKTFTRFVTTDGAGQFDTVLYRKEASNGYFYHYTDLNEFGQGALTFTQPKVEVNFLRETLATGTTWNNDFNATANGVTFVVRFKYTCTNAAASVTYNGNTFNNVYEIKFEFQVGANGVFQTQGQLFYYFAKGIGQINVKDFLMSNPPQVNDEFHIRRWQVF